MKALALISIMAACTVPTTGYGHAAVNNDAVAQAANGDAERVLTQTLYDLSEGTFVFGCSADGELLPDGEGEPLILEGRILERFSLVTDPAGGTHYTVKTRPLNVRGIGKTSGEDFRITESVHFVGNERLEGETLSYRQNFKLVGKETHRAFLVVASGHYLILADGTITLHRDDLRVECTVQR